MIPVQIKGRIRRASLFLYLVILLLSSCSSFNKQLYSGNIYLNSYSYYFNDSLGFSVKLSGDNVQNTDKKKLKHKLKSDSNKPYKSNVLEFFETIVGPNYDVYLLGFKNKVDIESFFSSKNFEAVHYSNDQKEVEVFDSTDFIYGKAQKNEDSSYMLLLAYSREKKYTIYQLLVEEFSALFKTINYTKEYRSILPKPFEMGFEQEFNFDQSINYLRPIVQLKKHANMYGEDHFGFIQAICTYSSRVSNSKIFDHYFDKYLKMTVHTDLPEDKYLAKNEGAINEILNISSNANLVMFNENHFNVKHRKLVRLLLKEYYELGFRYLGLEALTEDSKSLNERGYPIVKSGFYIREPEMANLIREAIHLGFDVFGYDTSGNKREINQAKNIFKKTFEKVAAAKVLVLGGFDHLLEKEDKDSKKWMAYYFHELYGIDPVTFAQTILKPNDNLWLGMVKNDSISQESFDYLISNNLSDSVFINQKEKEFSIDLPESKFNKEYILSIYIKMNT